jgi:hypothetical protein
LVGYSSLPELVPKVLNSRVLLSVPLREAIMSVVAGSTASFDLISSSEQPKLDWKDIVEDSLPSLVHGCGVYGDGLSLYEIYGAVLVLVSTIVELRVALGS